MVKADHGVPSNIRVGAYAVIIRDCKILLTEINDENGFHYNFPGGGHEDGETITKTLNREVREETTANVSVGPLLVVYEYAPFLLNHKYGPVHKMGLLFECMLLSGSEPRLPEHHGPADVGVTWVPFDELSALNVIPNVHAALVKALAGAHPQLVELTE